MTTSNFTLATATVFDTPSIDGLVTQANLELAPLLSHLIKGFTFNAGDESRQSQELRFSVTYEDGATPILNPFKVSVFTGKTLEEAGDAADAFFTANPGYFFAPVVTQVLINTARRSVIIYLLVMYNEDATEGASHFAGSGAGSGGVTSVGLTAPTQFTVTGSPVVGAGTLDFAWNSQTENTVLAGPATPPSSVPAFRALVSADIPNLNASKITAGTLATARGGTGVDGSAAANGTLLIGNGAGYTLASLTGGTGITITPGVGSITIDATSSATIGGSIAVNQVAYGSGANTIQGSAALLFDGTDLTCTGTIKSTQSGSGTNAAFVAESVGDPIGYAWNLTSGGADAKQWDATATTDELRFRTIDDSNNATSWMVAARSGATPARVTIPITTAASASNAGAVVVGDGALATSVAIGGGLIYAGKDIYSGNGYSIDSGLFLVCGTRTAASGFGGNIRYRDDTGTLRWAAGVLGAAAEVNFSIYDIVGADFRMTLTPAGLMRLYAAAGTALTVDSTDATAAISSAGTVRALAYRFNSGSLLADYSANYHTIYTQANVVGIYLGGAGDPANYYDNTVHHFRGLGAAFFADLDTNGLTVGASTGNHAVSINGAAGALRQLVWQSAAVARWNAYAATNAESGGDAGSPWILSAYTDAGAYIDDVINATRAAGGTLTFGRPISALSSVAATGTITGSNVQRGTGTPEGAVTGVVGDIFERTDGGTGTSLYIKESGAGNTGWVAVTTSGATIGGSIAVNQVAYGSGANTIQGSANLTYSGDTVTVGSAASAAVSTLQALGQAGTRQLAMVHVSGVELAVFEINDSGAPDRGIPTGSVGIASQNSWPIHFCTGGVSRANVNSTGIAVVGTITGSNVQRGAGTPEGAVTGVVGDIFERTDGGAGTTLYIKESGAGNTGWVAVSAGGGSIGGSIAVNQVAFGSGANTIQGDAKFVFTTASGLVVNLASSGADNLTIGSTAGNSLSSGTQNTLLGTNAGTALTTTSDNTAVGYNALAACTGAGQTAVGSGAAALVTSALRVTAVGYNALGAGVANPNDTTAIGHNALAACLSSENTAVGSNCLSGASVGQNNTAVGVSAASAITGGFNVAIGHSTLDSAAVDHNVAIGYQALTSCTGSANVAVGFNASLLVSSSLRTVSVGFSALAAGVAGVSDSTAIGHSALLLATGASNTAVGSAAGDAIVAGARNSAFGHSALSAAATTDNVAVGYQALLVCTVAENTAIGSGASDSLTTSLRTVSVGFAALGAGVAGVADSTAIGHNALLLATGVSNTAVGSAAGDAIVAGARNTAVGHTALSAAATSDNVAVGFQALTACTVAENTAVGSGAAVAITTSLRCVAVGYIALQNGSTGISDSTAVGHNALSLTVGLRNTAIGSSAGSTTLAGADNIFIGAYAGDATASGASNRCVIGSSTSLIQSVYIGNGETSTVPAAVTLYATGGSGSDINGAALSLVGGIGTGVGVGGDINFRTAKAGTSGSTPNTVVTRVSVLQDGALDWTGIATASAPAVSVASHGTIFYDSTLQKFRYSQNTGAYADCFGAGGGTIGGTIAANQVAFGSGADTIAGSALFTFTTASGLVVNLASSGANNLTIGSTAGNSLSSGTQNTLLGTNAGTALTTVHDSTAVGYNALAAATVGENVAIGSGASALLSTSLRTVSVGFSALGAGVAGVADSTALGYNALAAATGEGNTAVGSRAGDSITGGGYNTAVGFLALSAAAGDNNVAVGSSALIACTVAQNTAVGADSCATLSTSLRVVAVGYLTLSAGTTGIADSTAVGHSALALATGASNTAVGSAAGDAIVAGARNSALGHNALGAAATNDNVAVGYQALLLCTVEENTAIGSGAADALTTSTGVVAVGFNALGAASNNASSCTAVGHSALLLATGGFNTAVGRNAGDAITTAVQNTAVGSLSLSAGAGDNNVAVGMSALTLCTVAENTAVGALAADALTTSLRTVAVGFSALSAGAAGVADSTAIGHNSLLLATGLRNTALGSAAGAVTTTGTDNIFLGAYAGDSTAVGASNRCVIGSNTSSITTVYIGKGETSTAPAAVTLNVTGGSGADVAGAALNVVGGIGTGTGVGGDINFRTAKASTTSSTPNTVVTRVSVLQGGALDWTGIATAAEPAVAAANHGTIFYDSTLQKFRYSANGVAYADLVGGGSGLTHGQVMQRIAAY